MILFVNACVRTESRTKRLAGRLLGKLGGYEEVNLDELNLLPLDEERLNRRSSLIAAKNYDDPVFKYAKQFASADTIVIAAPYWDLSFPSILKIYFENIYVTGLVSKYSAEGLPVGLCNAEKLYYVTTAGGPYVPDYSYGYIENMAKGFFGIKDTQLIKAEMLDVTGFDAEKIITETEKEIDGMFSAV